MKEYCKILDISSDASTDEIKKSYHDLFEMLSECDFQWIWAVFSASPDNIDDGEILK